MNYYVGNSTSLDILNLTPSKGNLLAYDMAIIMSIISIFALPLYQKPLYHKHDSFAFIEGLLEPGTVFSIWYTLPVGNAWGSEFLMGLSLFLALLLSSSLKKKGSRK